MVDKLSLEKIMRDISVQRRGDVVIRKNECCDCFIDVTVATVDLFMELIEKVKPYITTDCNMWLTDFGKDTVPRYFPHSTSIEVNELYDREEVFQFLMKEFAGSNASTTDSVFIPYNGQTSLEMVSLLKSIYIDVKGDQLLFTRKVKRSADTRFASMNNFAIDVLYEFCKELHDS